MYIAATLFTLVFLYSKFPDDYSLFRNTLAIGTLCGLIGFASFPLMPPRLLDDTILLNGVNAGNWFGFVDTLVEYPTFWSFNDETIKSISNQFAAMPSLHCGWAFFTLIALLPRVKSRWAKTLVVLYPIMTVYVVVITGKKSVANAIKATSSGAYDYVTKPFAFEELLARVEALLRRPRAMASPQLCVADLALDQGTRDVRRGDEAIELTPKEFAVLEYLMRHTGRVMSRTLITEYAWGYHFDPGTNIVDVVINHLRKKIDAKFEKKLITTVRGVGYMIRG